MSHALRTALLALIAASLMALAGTPPARAAETPVIGESPLRLAQDIPAAPKMTVPDAKLLAISVVPDLRGRTAAQARDLLAKSGLQLGEIGRVSSQQAAGTVVRQAPAAGGTATRGSAVNIWIAEAPSLRVPNLVGRPLKEAEGMLAKSGLRLGQVSTVASSSAEGTVVRQYPAANQAADKGSAVNVWIAGAAPVKQPDLVKVPDLLKRQVGDAEPILAKSGLRLGNVSRIQSTSPEGTVLRQSPSPGQNIDRGSPVSVWVAEAAPEKQPEAVRVPDLGKRQVKEAAAILAKSGLRLGEVTPLAFDAPEGTVLRQSPSAGQSVGRDTAVNVWIAEVAPVKVPNLVGLPLQRAEAALAKTGLRRGEVTPIVSESPEGTVARQSPAAGGTATRGSTVDLRIAEARAVTVPDLRGLSPEAASQRLRDAGLRLGAQTKRPSLAPGGEVIEQKPPAGAEARAGAAVDVAMGDGSRLRVPGIVGESEGASLERLRSAGLRPGERRAEESGEPEGRVLRQRPAEGSVVPRGSAVAYWVAVPDKVTVPRLIGLTAGGATTQLEPLGLSGEQVGAEESDRPEGEILRQEPEPGARVPRGSRVGFWVASSASVTVPDLSGMPGPEAAERLRADGLIAGESQTEESREREGTVIRQDPAPGERVPPGTAVNYWIAAVPTVPVPELGGLGAEEARARLSELGLRMTARPPEENDAPEETVIGHDPAAGMRVPLGTDIAVRISAGRPLSPWVLGGGIGAALLAAGGGLWLARRPPRGPTHVDSRAPSAPRTEVRVRMGKPDASVEGGLSLDPRLPVVGVRTRLELGDGEVSAEKLVLREERRQS